MFVFEPCANFRGPNFKAKPSILSLWLGRARHLALKRGFCKFSRFSQNLRLLLGRGGRALAQNTHPCECPQGRSPSSVAFRRRFREDPESDFPGLLLKVENVAVSGSRFRCRSFAFLSWRTVFSRSLSASRVRRFQTFSRRSRSTLASTRISAISSLRFLRSRRG